MNTKQMFEAISRPAEVGGDELELRDLPACPVCKLTALTADTCIHEVMHHAKRQNRDNMLFGLMVGMLIGIFIGAIIATYA
jgi:ABC-type microcin C transport system permease subunit YejE